MYNIVTALTLRKLQVLPHSKCTCLCHSHKNDNQFFSFCDRNALHLLWGMICKCKVCFKFRLKWNNVGKSQVALDSSKIRFSPLDRNTVLLWLRLWKTAETSLRSAFTGSRFTAQTVSCRSLNWWHLDSVPGQYMTQVGFVTEEMALVQYFLFLLWFLHVSIISTFCLKFPSSVRNIL